MKKQLDTDAISNELKGASLFFNRPPGPLEDQPASSAPEEAGAGAPPASPTSSEALETRPAEDRTPRTGRTTRTSRTPSTSRAAPIPPKRHMIRHAFEIYHDQYQSLVRLAAEERIAGGAGSMSRMVREAIDRFITKRAGE